MGITRISFIQTFPTGLYANQKIGIETEIDDNQLPISFEARDNVIKGMFEKNKKLVEEAFIQMNPQINWNDNGGIKDLGVYENYTKQTTIAEPPNPIQAFKDLINSKYQTKKTLESLRTKVEELNDEGLTNEYLLRLKQFE
jgi:hypothetical protein